MNRIALASAVLLVTLLTSCTAQTGIPAVTATASLTPESILLTSKSSFTPSPTATPTYAQTIYPYTVAGLREHNYESGEIKIIGLITETEWLKSYFIEYPSDGLRITGVLNIPAQGRAPFPVIVMNHGFFSRSVYRSGDGTDRAAEFLNKRGYITVSSDYRSWAQSDSGTSLYYSGLAIDVVNLINALPSIPEADAARIGMWGHSMGGGVTMKVLTMDARVKAAVLYSTVSADQSDVLARWGLGCFGDILAGEQLVGCNSSDVVPLDLPSELLDAFYAASTSPEMLAEISPIFHLDLVTALVQIHYGERDGEIYSGTPPEWSKKLYQAFLDAEKPAKLFGYKGEKHSFVGDPWFKFMEECAHFFDVNVKNTP